MKLIAIDMDGTLLSDDGTISGENRKSIYKMQELENIVSICSGRSIQDVIGIIEEAEIRCPIISANGAVVYDGKEIIADFGMDSKIVSEITSSLIAENYYFELYTNKGIYISAAGRDILEKEIARLRAGDVDFPVGWADEQIEIQFNQKGLQYVNSYKDMNIAGLDIYKIFVLSFDIAKLEKLEKELFRREDISITTSGWTKIEIAHPFVSKGNGLRLLADHLGIPMEDTVAIGDNENDIPMFETAGISIAMGNASEKIKSKCTHVTKDYTENGVAYALMNYILQK